MTKLDYKKNTIAFVIPTGVGASIGGFAGDASQIAREFSKHFHLVVNPNVVNAACFSGINENMEYVEGYSLSQFFKNKIALKPLKENEQNKIGIIFDKGIKQNILNIHINVVNAMKLIYGFDVVGFELTEEPIRTEIIIENGENSSGNVENIEYLLKASKKLIQKGAQAICIVCRFDDSEIDKRFETDYRSGKSVDPIAGLEAIISHFLSQQLNIPCVHAPAFDDICISNEILDAKVACEYVTSTFLPCLFWGLNKAANIVDIKSIDKYNTNNILFLEDILALVLPYGCLGSSIVFDAIERNIPVITVKENRTIFQLTKKVIGCTTCGIIEVENYQKCIKYLKDLKR